MALAFGSAKTFEENKDNINIEYYPEDILEFARDHIKFVKKTEGML